jgi:hypothetical protein
MASKMGNPNEAVMFRHSSPVRLSMSAGVFAAALAPAAARAATTCAVRVTPGGTPGWQAAADRLQAALSGPGARGDCETVEVKVRDGGAELVFTTRDGRRAVRELAAPSELGPTVQMLSVTGPAPPSPAPVAVERDVSVATPRVIVVPNERARVLYGGGVGVRAGADTLVSPLLRAFGSMALGRWELGVLAQWEIRYNQIANPHPGAQPAWALAGSVRAARRQPLSRAMSLLAGADLTIAALDEESSEHSENEGRAEARVGAFVGAVLPRDTPTRWRAIVGADFAPSHFGKSSTNTDGVPLLPWWALTLTVGVELGR